MIASVIRRALAFEEELTKLAKVAPCDSKRVTAEVHRIASMERGRTPLDVVRSVNNYVFRGMSVDAALEESVCDHSWIALPELRICPKCKVVQELQKSVEMPEPLVEDV